MTTATEHHETVIVGGGQAGLATAYHLQRRGRDCVILDAGERVGHAWRRRWPSLRLYSPAHLDGLPGMPFPGPARACPTAGEMADHLEAYAERYSLPIRLGVRVDRVERAATATWSSRATTRSGPTTSSSRPASSGGVSPHPGLRRRPRPARHAAPLRGLPRSRPARARSRAGRRGGALRQRHRLRLARAGFSTTLSGRDTGELPVGSTAGSCGRWHRSCGSC